MKKFSKIVAWIGVVIGLVSCSSDKKEVESLKSEVIEIHDEVMPLMGELKSEQKRIEEKADELELEDSIANLKKVADMRSTAVKLEQAYEGMFVWMRQYKGELEGMDEVEAIKYLSGQKELVTKVNEDIKDALEEAGQIEE